MAAPSERTPSGTAGVPGDSLLPPYAQLLFTFRDLNVGNDSRRISLPLAYAERDKIFSTSYSGLIIILHSFSPFMTKLEYSVVFGDNSHAL